MGSRTADKLKEIEELRGGLERKLDRLETELPLAGWGRRLAAASGMLIPIIAFIFRTMRERSEKNQAKAQAAVEKANVKATKAELKAEAKARKRNKRAPEPEPTPAPAPSQPVVVNVLPKGAAAVGAAAVAVWAGIKLFEMLQDRNDGA